MLNLNCSTNRKLTTPIVHEHHSEDMFVAFVDGNGITEFVSTSNEEGHFQLHIHQLARPVDGRLAWEQRTREQQLSVLLITHTD